MLVELTITPVGSLHMSREVAKVVQILKTSGLTFQLGPMATCIEGDWDQLFGVIRQCHEAVAKSHGVRDHIDHDRSWSSTIIIPWLKW